jgi:hypothetical protein
MLDASSLSEIDLFKHLPDSCLEALEKDRNALSAGSWTSFVRGTALQKTARGYRKEGSVLQLRESHRVSQFSGLLPGLSLYSYRVRELAACLLFFTLFFAVLARLILGGVLAYYAAIYASHWARTRVPATATLALASAEVHLETIGGARQLK